jgi:putative tryptophan/tyrosine transport system permease protein
MILLIGSLTVGLILAIMAMGVYITFRIHNFPDITMEGSFVFGAAVAATLIAMGVNPWIAATIAFASGMVAGLITGVLHTVFKFNGLLSGILVMTALYSVNLRVMDRSNLPLPRDSETQFTQVTRILSKLSGKAPDDLIEFIGYSISLSDASAVLFSFTLASLIAILIYAFLKTNLGTAMRARGDNEQMIRALGVNSGFMLVLGLMVSNGLIGFSGALFAQYQTFADVQMGLGMLVWGLASVIIGEALVRTNSLGYALIGCLMGAVLFRLLVALALRFGLNPNDLKLITAVFVFIALALPGLLQKMHTSTAKRLKNAKI